MITAISMKPTALKLYVDDCGTTAVEFAILSPVFLGMVIGILGLGLLLFIVGDMHYAVEQAARCASVRTTVCTDQASITAYAKSQYLAPGAPKFTYQSGLACGNSVSATLSYTARLGLRQVTLPLSATACFPG
jgi:Flp pilus assembly protein TadG